MIIAHNDDNNQIMIASDAYYHFVIPFLTDDNSLLSLLHNQ